MSFDEEHLDNHQECQQYYENEKRAKDGAYKERNALVAVLSKIFPAMIIQHEDTPGEVWENDWRNIVMILLPTGQVSWHIHDSELAQFDHLAGSFVGPLLRWDGHTTEEKYKRLADLPEGFFKEYD